MFFRKKNIAKEATIESSIAEMMQKKLADGSIEKIIEEKLAKCIGDCVDDMFRWSGDAKKLIETKLKETMVPAIEHHDFNNFTLKLESVLTEIINTTALKDNKAILENFKLLMIEDKEEVTLEDIFKQWCSYVAKNVETDGLEVDYDEGAPRYQFVYVEGAVDDIENVRRNSPEKKVIRFTCSHDEEMNLQFEVYKYDFMKGYEVSGYGGTSINRLSFLNEMEIMLLKLSRNCTKISITDDYMDKDVRPSKEPEVSYS